jgi:hypothetical protein
MVKKKVAAVSISSMEAFPTAGLTLQLEVPTVAASIPGPKLGEECWNSGLDGRLEAVAASIQLEAAAASMQLEAAVAATSKSARLWETLPMASQVLDLYENPVIWKFDLCMSKNLNS